MKYIKGLDALRAFAIFFVLIEHSGVWFDTSVTNGKFIKQVLIPGGQFGVILFFVLSGYLITNILLTQRYNNNPDTSRFPIIKSFYVRRALRIFPIYYLFLLLLYVIDFPYMRENIAYHVTYTTNFLLFRTNEWNNFSHIWTLCIEEQFYLLWPWVIIFVPEKYLKPVFLFAILIGVGSTYYCMNVIWRIAPFMVFNCFDAFGVGGLLAYSLLHQDFNKHFQRWLPRVAILAMCIYYYWMLGMFFNIEIYGLGFLKIIMALISVWLVNLVIKAKPSIFRRYFLENRILTFIGKISYGIYLYHYVYIELVYYPLNDYLNKITVHYTAINTLVRDRHFYYWLHMVIIIAISALSYYTIEKAFLGLKRFFRYNKQPVVS